VPGGPPQRNDHCQGRWRRNDQHYRQRHRPKRFRPLTCGFGAPGRTRTCTYGLEVDPRVSVPSHTVPFLLVRSSTSSRRYGPVVWCVAWRNDRENDCETDTGCPRSLGWCSPVGDGMHLPTILCPGLRSSGHGCNRSEIDRHTVVLDEHATPGASVPLANRKCVSGGVPGAV
jgi:hypothetical protein